MRTISDKDKETLESYAQAGFKILSSICPEFHQEIDVSSLNIAHDCQCVIGQIDGSFGNNKDVWENILKKHNLELESAGLIAPRSMNGWAREAHGYLTECWKNLIQQKLDEEEKEDRLTQSLMPLSII